jgi:hypothetical protein
MLYTRMPFLGFSCCCSNTAHQQGFCVEPGRGEEGEGEEEEEEEEEVSTELVGYELVWSMIEVE